MSNNSSPSPMFLQISTANLEIPLRYYKGWNIIFSTNTETFSSPILSLFGYSNTKDLEKAMDFAIEKRG